MNSLATFPALLKQYRTQRELSLSSVVKRSQLSKATLNNWEAGRTRPSTHELELLTAALELSAGQQLALYRALALPRALATLPKNERPPLTGGLLRAMRLRCGLSQSEVARRLEVRQGTLAKWEKSEDWPRMDRLCALCAVLGARLEELEAILGGVFLPSHLSHDAPLETLELVSQALTGQAEQAPQDPLLDLRFLELESLLWFRQDCPEIRTLECWVWRQHLAYLSFQRRNSEVQDYTDKMLSSPTTCDPRTRSYLQTAVIYKADALHRRDLPQAQRTPHCQRAITFLRANESRVTDRECRAWYWMLLGELLTEVGDIGSAWECVQRSNAIPHPHGEERIRTMEARLSTAGQLVEMNRAQEGIALLESLPNYGREPGTERTKIRRLIHHTKALIKLQDFSVASEQLRYLYYQLEEEGLSSFRSSADALSQQLDQATQKL